MNAIAKALDSTTLGTAQTYDNVTIYPLLARRKSWADYLTLSISFGGILMKK